MRQLVACSGLLLAVAAAGCSERPPAKPPSIWPPPPTLVSRLQEFRALAAAGPARPDEATLTELSELVSAAFQAGVDSVLARKALARLERDEQAGFAYEEGLTHQDATVRAQCAWRLGELGRAAAIPTLLWRLRYELDNSVRLWMIESLVRLGNFARLDLLVEFLDDGQVAEHAGALALRLDAAAWNEASSEPTWDELKGIVRRLHTHWRTTGVAVGAPPTEIGPALEACFAGGLADLTEFQLRPVDHARVVLTNMGAAPLPLLRRALSAEEFYLRFHTIEIVRDIGRPAGELGDALIPLLGDPACRVAAIEALGEIGSHAPVTEMFRAALRDDDPEVRAAVAGAVGPLGADELVEDLQRRLNDPSESMDVRVRAAFSLAFLAGGEGEGRVFLLARRQSEDYHAPTLDELLTRLEERQGPRDS